MSSQGSGKITNRSARCVHCLQETPDITADHLFPKSWYPATTPANLEKWSFPACHPCNRDYGRLEEALRIKLSACIDPNAEASAGIWSKTLDSFNPNRAKTPLDAFKRKLARAKFLKGLMPAPSASTQGILPEIDPARPKGNQALLINARDLHKFIEKLVRGTVYITEQRYITEDQKVTVAIIDRSNEAEFLTILEKFGELYERGPGIRIRKAVAHEARANAMFVFDVWNQFRFYGSVLDLEPGLL